MIEHRNFEQDLVELALGEVAEPRRSELLSHLSGCLRCRASYGDVVSAIDATVPVAPETQPPAGFDVKVLAAMGIDAPGQTAARRHLRRLATGRSLLAAAAIVLAVAAGIWTGGLLQDQPGANQQPVAADSVVLHTGDGERVGVATVAWMEDSRVLVVSVNDAPVGVPYSCRVQLADGQSEVLGRWEASSTGGGTWVMHAPQGELNTIELVHTSGAVWASAQLP